MKEVLEDHLREHLGAEDISQKQRTEELEAVISILKSYLNKLSGGSRINIKKTNYVAQDSCLNKKASLNYNYISNIFMES